MTSFNSDDLLEAALAQLGREQGDPSLVAHSMFRNGTHLKGTDDEEPHNMNPVLFVDEYGREIKGSMSAEDASRPGLHTQEAVESGAILDKSNMREYTTEDAIQDEVSNALYDELFRMARGKSEFSNESLDKKKQMTDYLNNDQRLIESLIRRGKIKA